MWGNIQVEIFMDFKTGAAHIFNPPRRQTSSQYITDKKILALDDGVAIPFHKERDNIKRATAYLDSIRSKKPPSNGAKMDISNSVDPIFSDTTFREQLRKKKAHYKNKVKRLPRYFRRKIEYRKLKRRGFEMEEIQGILTAGWEGRKQDAGVMRHLGFKKDVIKDILESGWEFLSDSKSESDSSETDEDSLKFCL
jgi:hypothetical protein